MPRSKDYARAKIAADDDVIISIGPDGRVFFHDLDPDLLAVALALDPSDRLMTERMDRAKLHHEDQKEVL